MRLKGIATTILIISLALILSVITLFNFALPHYLATKLIPRLANSYHLPLSLKIRHIGLTQTDLSDIIIGNKTVPDIRIDSMRLDYSPAMLRQRRISRLVIAGLTINARLVDGKLLLPDFIKNLPGTPVRHSPSLPPAYDYGRTVAKVIIVGAVLNITTTGSHGAGEQLLKIPWQLKFTPLTNGQYKAELEIVRDKQHIWATALLDSHRKTIRLAVNMKNTASPMILQAADLGMTISSKTTKAQRHKHDHRRSYTSTGQTDIKIGGPLNDKLQIKPLDLRLAFNGNYQKNGRWQLSINTAPRPAPLELNGNNYNITSMIKNITVHGTGNGADFSLQYNLAFTDTKLTSGDTTLLFDKLRIQGEGDRQGTRLIAKFSGSGKINDVKIGRLNGNLPIHWPPRLGKAGRLTITDIYRHDLPLGNASFDLSQNKNGFDFTGTYTPAQLAGLCLAVNGDINLAGPQPAVAFHFKNACTKHFNNLELGSFNPKLHGYTIDTDLEINGAGSYKSNLFEAHLNSALHNINLRGENDFNLQGGDFSLTFPEPRLRSRPGHFSFKQIRFGDITMQDGLLDFQVESANSILLEKSSAKWCGGHIHTQAARFSPAGKDYDLIVYCDRLNAAQLLEQFGAATADGQGRVTGKIPIKISAGRLIPQDGFLYSTPGEGGTIKLRNTERLTAGIPEGTPQFAQIDLAREALKNFSYKWVSIDLSGQGDELLMHLQIDGKPAAPLPFVYKKEFGGFARVEAGSPGSYFQGIKLDVNFRLPLNQLLYYGSSIKQLAD